MEKKTGKLWRPARWKRATSILSSVDSIVRAQELGDILGINLTRAEFLLYFEPAGGDCLSRPD